MKYVVTLLMIVLFVVSFSTPAPAQSKPVQLALFNPIQIHPETNSISGVRLSLLYGKNTSVTGVDLGLVNQNTDGESVGWQCGLVGLNEDKFTGLQSSIVNLTDRYSEGVMLGFYNYAGNMNGVQIGFINNAGSMNGLQIGLINIIKKGGQFPVFPIVNWSF
jgi:hypothetical protein